MIRRKTKKLTLRVRETDLSMPSAMRDRLEQFDSGWAARQHAENYYIPVEVSPYFLAGWMAADAAWNARFTVGDRA